LPVAPVTRTRAGEDSGINETFRVDGGSRGTRRRGGLSTRRRQKRPLDAPVGEGGAGSDALNKTAMEQRPGDAPDDPVDAIGRWLLTSEPRLRNARSHRGVPLGNELRPQVGQSVAKSAIGRRRAGSEQIVVHRRQEYGTKERGVSRMGEPPSEPSRQDTQVSGQGAGVGTNHRRQGGSDGITKQFLT